MINSVLFVCTGNTCRSVMAEYLLKHHAEKKGISLRVSSAGVGAFSGDSANKHAVDVLAELGIDAGEHRSSLVNPYLLEEFDLVLAMTESHKYQLLQAAPHLKERVHLLKAMAKTIENVQELDEEIEKSYNVSDPFGQSIEIYRQSRDEINSAVKKVLQNIIVGGKR
ncbi:MAG TPA: low molecular weight protein arginine phosphatase [Natronincola sp.]|nr:low molecular weight protein arginine phosphatase [Natronincola sp.]